MWPCNTTNHTGMVDSSTQPAAAACVTASRVVSMATASRGRRVAILFRLLVGNLHDIRGWRIRGGRGLRGGSAYCPGAHYYCSNSEIPYLL